MPKKTTSHLENELKNSTSLDTFLEKHQDELSDCSLSDQLGKLLRKKGKTFGIRYTGGIPQHTSHQYQFAESIREKAGYEPVRGEENPRHNNRYQRGCAGYY